MSFLIEQIKNQKILEMEVDFDSFIKEKGISESSMIHTMIFDKEVFAEEKEVREYLKDKYFYNPEISEEENSFIAILVSPSQMDLETEIEVEIRRGVIAKAADMLPVMKFEELSFNAKGEINLSSKFGTINLHEGLPHIIEIARVAEGEHPSYGKLKITQEHLESMEKNFRSNAVGVDLAVNEDHRKNEAFGWFKDLFLSFDKQTLYGQVKWNKKGTQALSEKEYRYFSPEFRFNYVHPHTGEEFGPTLLGGALTNYPFLKMEAITELNQKQQPEGKTVSEKTIELAVHNEKVVELSNKISDLQGKLDAKDASIVDLNDKVSKLESEIESAKKQAAHKKLFDEGKINKAQLVALNEGKTFLEVLALNEKMNMDGKGSSDAPKGDTIELSEKEKKVCEQLNLTPEEFVQFNK
jgi:phage I-like protein